jgi:hypothetical protein
MDDKSLPSATQEGLKCTTIYICPGRKENLVWCVFHSVQSNIFRCPECSVELCVTPSFQLYHTKLHFWRLTLSWKSGRHRQKYCNYFHYWNNIFSSLALFCSNNKARRVWILQTGFWKKQGHIWRVFICIPFIWKLWGTAKEQLLVDIYKSITSIVKIIRVLPLRSGQSN